MTPRLKFLIPAAASAALFAISLPMSRRPNSPENASWNPTTPY